MLVFYKTVDCTPGDYLLHDRRYYFYFSTEKRRSIVNHLKEKFKSITFAPAEIWYDDDKSIECSFSDPADYVYFQLWMNDGVDIPIENDTL